jgi:hypothetical protein
LSGCAQVGGRPQARAGPGARIGARRRWWLPGDALVELEGRGGLEQRIGGGIVLGIGGRPQRRAAVDASAVTAVRSGKLGASTPK